MKKVTLALALVFAMIFSPIAFAQEGDLWSMANSPEYGKKAGGMLGRGVLNFATSFVDIIVQTVNGTQDGPPFVGTLTGLGSGLACTALRATSGALDVVTFWVPGFNGIPVSRSYSNCLEPEEESAPAGFAEPTPVPTQSFTNETPQARPKAVQDHSPLAYVKK